MKFDLIQQGFGISAGVIAALSAIPYYISIFRGETIPHRSTYQIWLLINAITFTSYWASGATATLYIAGVYVPSKIILVLVSIKRGTGGKTKIDLICLAGAVVGMLLWVITSNPLYALYLTIFSGSLGYIPTLIKTYKQPFTENALSWNMAAVAATLNLFAISEPKFQIFFYPIYIFIGDTSLAFLIHQRRKKLNGLH